jgi:hypothetical protein
MANKHKYKRKDAQKIKEIIRSITLDEFQTNLEHMKKGDFRKIKIPLRLIKKYRDKKIFPITKIGTD